MTLARDRRTGETKGPQTAVASYTDDPYTWALQQADLLRAGRLELIDTASLADEISALAHYLADKLRSDLSRILQHLLKWDHQPQVRTRIWVLTIEEHRHRVARHFKRVPGLRSTMDDLLEAAYAQARFRALKETGLPRSALPETCPYSWDEIMTRPVAWPEQP